MMEKSPRPSNVDSLLRGYYQQPTLFMEKLTQPGVQEEGLLRLEYKYYFYSIQQELDFFKEFDGHGNAVAFAKETSAFLKKVYIALVTCGLVYKVPTRELLDAFVNGPKFPGSHQLLIRTPRHCTVVWAKHHYNERHTTYIGHRHEGTKDNFNLDRFR